MCVRSSIYPNSSLVPLDRPPLGTASLALPANLPVGVMETATSSRSIQQVSLLGLPAELRNEIWKLALGGRIFEVYCWPSYCPKRMATMILNRCKNFSCLLRTCRQIYHEARLIPLAYNGFRLRNEDGLIPWLDTFDKCKQEAIAEIHIVTWRAVHMVEGLGWSLKQVSDVLPLQRLSGLERLVVEVRTKSSCKACRQDLCTNCEPRLELTEARLKGFVASHSERVDVVFRRQPFATIAASQVL
jgi:hypothetical protein